MQVVEPRFSCVTSCYTVVLHHLSANSHQFSFSRFLQLARDAYARNKAGIRGGFPRATCAGSPPARGPPRFHASPRAGSHNKQAAERGWRGRADAAW